MKKKNNQQEKQNIKWYWSIGFAHCIIKLILMKLNHAALRFKCTPFCVLFFFILSVFSNPCTYSNNGFYMHINLWSKLFPYTYVSTDNLVFGHRHQMKRCRRWVKFHFIDISQIKQPANVQQSSFNDIYSDGKIDRSKRFV